MDTLFFPLGLDVFFLVFLRFIPGVLFDCTLLFLGLMYAQEKSPVVFAVFDFPLFLSFFLFFQMSSSQLLSVLSRSKELLVC